VLLLLDGPSESKNELAPLPDPDVLDPVLPDVVPLDPVVEPEPVVPVELEPLEPDVPELPLVPDPEAPDEPEVVPSWAIASSRQHQPARRMAIRGRLRIMRSSN